MAVSNWLRFALFSHRQLHTLRIHWLLTTGYTVLVPLTTRRSSRFRATSFGTFLTNAWPEARAVRSIRGDPGNATNCQAFANPYYLAFPQGLHDPQTKRLGSCVS